MLREDTSNYLLLRVICRNTVYCEKESMFSIYNELMFVELTEPLGDGSTHWWSQRQLNSNVDQRSETLVHQKM